MNTEPLQKIMDLSNDKKNTLFYFLDPDIVKKIYKHDLEFKDFYINDKIFCIKRNTLELSLEGKILCMDNNRIGVKKNKNLTIYINPQKYYIFVKQSTKKQNQKDFFKKLLEEL
jgi:hypothetical protein|tara:strand:- start:1080 stop:1421 length:342 start_codon:yes stop_codon:yes gene_type:complete